LAELEVRPVRDTEVATWVELHNRVEPQLPVVAEYRRIQRGQEPTLTDLLALLDGAPVGAAAVEEIPWQRGSRYALGWWGVLADARGRGVGAALYEAVSAHARALGKDGVQVDVWEDEDAGRAFLEQRGFAEVERFDVVALDLRRARTAALGPPSGVALTTLAERPDLVPQMWEIHREAIFDVPAEEAPEPEYEGWHRWEIERPDVRKELTFLAVAGSELVGYASLSVPLGTRDGWHGWTAVRREWRRRGIGLALKRAQIDAARRADLERLVTFNEMRNEAMRALNARLGYEPRPAQLRLRGPLAP
jgi:mycothiol synthase